MDLCIIKGRCHNITVFRRSNAQFSLHKVLSKPGQKGSTTKRSEQGVEASLQSVWKPCREYITYPYNITYQNSIMKLSQLVQQLWFGLINWKLFPLYFYRSGGIPLPRKQHSRLILVETEKNGPRLKFFSRRRVGVVGHGLEEVSLVVKSSQRLLKNYFLAKREYKSFHRAH